MNERLINENEKTYFIICVVLSVFAYIAIILSIIGIFYLLIGVLINFVLHGLMVANIRNNGVKLTHQQFPEVFSLTAELCNRMKIDGVPDIYVVQNAGALNAFATKFFGRNFIVIYSDIFELIEDGNKEQLAFIIGHELAHIKRRHVSKQLLILPALWIPFLGNAYSRACEYTCDAMATAFTGNAKAAIESLTMLAIGRHLFKKVNVSDYIMESNNQTGFFIWLSHILSTHPPLPKRIKEVDRLNRFPQMYGYHSNSFEVTSNLA